MSIQIGLMSAMRKVLLPRTWKLRMITHGHGLRLVNLLPLCNHPHRSFNRLLPSPPSVNLLLLSFQQIHSASNPQHLGSPHHLVALRQLSVSQLLCSANRRPQHQHLGNLLHRQLPAKHLYLEGRSQSHPHMVQRLHLLQIHKHRQHRHCQRTHLDNHQFQLRQIHSLSLRPHCRQQPLVNPRWHL